MSAPTSSATIEFPFSAIDGEIREVLEGYGVQFKREPFNPVLELADPLYDLEVEVEEGDIFRLQNGEARYGEFEELEKLLIKKGIPFDRNSSMDWDREPGTRVFRPGDPPLDLWIADIPGSISDIQRLVKQAYAAFNGEPGPDGHEQSDDDALDFLAEAESLLDELNPTYPPLADYVKGEA